MGAPEKPIELPPLAEAYVLREELGRGAFGVVWRAQHRETGAWAAVKVPHLALDEEGRARALREIRLAGTLDQPGLTRLLGAYLAGPRRIALAYELVEGDQLRERLPKEGLPPDQALAWAAPLAEALDALHRAGLVHRDLKPANVLVTSGDQVKLCDLGLMRTIDEGDTITKTGEIHGTPYFMAPEVLSGGRVDAGADRYAFGCLVFWMLAGGPPFLGDQMEVVTGHLHERPRRAKVLGDRRDVGVNRVLRRMLAKAPEDRYPTAREGVEALAEALRAAPPPASPDSTVERTRQDLVGPDASVEVQGSLLTELPAASPGPARGRLSALLGLGVLAVLLGGLWPRGPAPPAPTSPPPPPPREPRGGPLGPDPVGRVQEELARRGTVSPDSRRWGELLASLPHIQDWSRWLREETAASELAPQERRALADAGRLYRERGLLSPFRPFLVQPAPVCAVGEDFWLRELEDLALGDQGIPAAGPWLCQAAAASDVGRQLQVELVAELEAAPRGPYPGGVQLSSGAVLFAFKTPNLGAFLDMALRTDENNPRAWRWTRKALAELRILLAAGGRTLAHEAGDRRLAAILLVHWIGDMGDLFWSPLAWTPMELLVGPAAEDPAALALRARVLRQVNRVRRSIEGQPDAALVARERAAWEALAETPGTDPLAHRLRGLARNGQFRLLEASGDSAGVLALLGRYLEERSLGDPEEASLLEQVSAELLRDFGALQLPEPMLAGVLARFERNQAAIDRARHEEGFAARRLAELRERYPGR